MTIYKLNNLKYTRIVKISLLSKKLFCVTLNIIILQKTRAYYMKVIVFKELMLY